MTMSQPQNTSILEDVEIEDKTETESVDEDTVDASTETAPPAKQTDTIVPGEEQNGHYASESRAETPDNASDHGRSRPMSASSSTSTLNRGGVRSTSSKFASLRATFEQKLPVEKISSSNSTKKRQHDKSAEKNQEHEVEVARLKDELEKEKELRIAFEEKTTSLEEEIDELNEALGAREQLWRSENERQGMQLKSEAEDRLQAVASEARRQQEEATNLQKQLSDIKRSFSTSTRAIPQVSDTTFRQEIDILQHEVQNWVVHNFRRVKIEASVGELCEKLEKVVEKEQLGCLQPVYRKFDSAAKLPIYQATVACYLMEILDEPYLFGIQGQRDWGKRLKQAAESLRTIFGPDTYHRWRAMTFDTLRQSDSIKEPVESAASGISEMICITLEAVTDVDESETRLPSLKAIIQRVISLAHLIRVQRAQYEFVLPSPGEAFDPLSMDDISDIIDSESEQHVRCAAFPALIKVGDEEGDELEPRNVVVKARVLCNEVQS